jgi:glycosyltransferase 2 family protein
MKPKAKSILQSGIMIALGVILVWFAYSQVADQKDKIIVAFTNANYFWVAVSSLIIVLSHFTRAYRWNYLLKPLGYKISFANASAAVFIGYFANYAPILRLGEVWRCTVTDRYAKVPFQVGFGTVVTERIVDTLILLVIFLLTLLFQFSELIGLSNYYVFDPLTKKVHEMSGLKLGIIVTILAAGLIALFALRKKIAGKLRGKFGNFINGFLQGLSSIRKMKNFGGFVFWSFAIWAMYFYSLYFCLKALPETAGIGHLECLTITFFGTFGVVFAPGGLGAYQIIVTNLLLFYSVDKAAAGAFPWLIWTAQLIVISLAGLLSFVLLPLLNKKKDVVPQ